MDSQEVIGLLMFFTTICSYINYKYIKLPKSIGITLVALLVTILMNVCSLFYTSINDFAELLVDNIGFRDTFLHGMLSVLLFAGSLHINATELSKHKLLITIFSTVTVIISTVLIAFSTYWITSLLYIPIPFYYCLMFGALISPTDAIIVINLLKTTSLPKSIEMKIAGEALFNDAMAIAIFFMALAIAYGQETSIEPENAILYFCREGLGGVLVGLVMGWLAAKVLETIDDHELAIILTLTLVTAGYVFANTVLNVSGPICMAITGLIIGSSIKKNGAYKNSMRRVEEFWDLLDALLNAILFVLIGLEFIRIDIHWSIAIASFVVIIASTIIRWISVFVPAACLAKFEKFNLAFVTIMTWGGLRGGISIALALSIKGDYRDHILTLTYFVVLWSIIVQGLTLKPLINKLQKYLKLVDHKPLFRF